MLKQQFDNRSVLDVYTDGRSEKRSRLKKEKRKDVESVGTMEPPPGRTVCSHFLLTIDYIGLYRV